LVIVSIDYQRIISLGFEGDYNILNTGFADMTLIFHFSTIDFPLTCNYAQFADEKNKERLNFNNKTPKSLANRKRKISWCSTLIVLAIIPTFIYVK
jgi:ABC-2 type transport system permease protein